VTLAPGVRLGPYEIVAPVGAGGMGEVYRASDTRLDRTVAIKVLPAHLAANPEFRQRLEREARAVASLSHPHTDFHALLIGMMRAAGIPARFEIGFSLPADRQAGPVPGYHCWAQFWLDDVGWVPVDASEAWKDPSRREYFFGAHDAHRILFTRGRDILLNPAQDGEPSLAS